MHLLPDFHTLDEDHGFVLFNGVNMIKDIFVLSGFISELIALVVTVYCVLCIHSLYKVIALERKDVYVPLIWVFLVGFSYSVAQLHWVFSGFGEVIGAEPELFWSVWEGTVFVILFNFIKFYTNRVLKINTYTKIMFKETGQ